MSVNLSERKTITAAEIKAAALRFGASVCGIGDIAGFEGEHPQRDPKQILPKAKCIIGLGIAVPSAFYDAMSEGRQSYNYSTVGVKHIDEELAEILLFKLAAIIENNGWDACTQRMISNLKIKGDKSTNPEVIDTYELIHAVPVAEGKPVPDVIIDFGSAAKVCGLGEVGKSGRILSPKYGPYIRWAFIITDCPLECDPEFEGGLCDNCGKCITACPGNAISDEGLDTWQCSVYYKGAHRSNPFMKDDFLKDNPNREAILNGEYRFNAESARAIYPELKFLPKINYGYSPCLCGKACDVACKKHLKESGRI